jgi:glycosyltransferase involved in cell wall biosynthesis
MQEISNPKWFGVEIRNYKIVRSPVKNQNPFLLDFETKLIRAESCLAACLELKSTGYEPDVVIAHPGWGEAIFIKECWPRTKLGIYCEYFYNYKGGDVGFDPEFQPNVQNEESKLRIKNITNQLSMSIADAAISPTIWQANTYPENFRDKITVIHDGIDTSICVPNPNAYLVLSQNNEKIRINKGDEVITFVNRHLEPYRGFHTFMRSLPEVFKDRPNAKVIIIGGTKVSYGFLPEKEKYGFDNWKDLMVHELSGKLTEEQWANIFFLGNVNYANYLNVLQISMVHVYLTYPFVLSWSLLEAMSCCCSIVASDTDPVKEVIEDGKTGRLVNFFDHKLLAESIVDLIQSTTIRKELGEQARKYVQENYDLKAICLPKQIKWVQGLNE